MVEGVVYGRRLINLRVAVAAGPGELIGCDRAGSEVTRAAHTGWILSSCTCNKCCPTAELLEILEGHNLLSCSFR